MSKYLHSFAAGKAETCCSAGNNLMPDSNASAASIIFYNYLTRINRNF